MRRLQSVLLRPLAVCGGALFLSLAGLFSSVAHAQPGGPPVLVLKNVTVHTMAGKPLEQAVIVVRRGKIQSVGKSARVPQGARVIDGKGRVVTPGLIDVRSALGVPPLARGGLSPKARVLDAIDEFAVAEIREVVAEGVTTVYVGGGPVSGLSARGAVYKTGTDRPLSERVILEEASVEAGVGVQVQTALGRVGEAEGLRAQLRAAEKYRETWDTYREELEEYLEKIEERKKDKKDGKEKGGGEKPDGEGAKDGKGEKPSEGKGGDDKPSDTPKPDSDPKKSLRFAGEPPAKDKKGNEKKGSGSEGKDKDKKKEEEDLKRPNEPKRNPDTEVLLRVLDGELSLRVEAHRAEDILNVLDLASDYPIDLVLVGCSEGYRVSSSLARAEVPVVLGEVLLSPLPRKDGFRFHRPGNAARLVEAGVSVALGSSGRAGEESRFLRANAALAVSHGLDRSVALSGMTVDAARVLGVSDRLGTIEKGKDADLVLYSGDPLDVRAPVDLVLIDGVIVYEKEGAGQ